MLKNLCVISIASMFLLGCAITTYTKPSIDDEYITGITPEKTIKEESRLLTTTIAFEKPQVRGLSAEEMWLPDSIRSSISRNFTYFARGHITVINIFDDNARAAEIQRSLSGSNDELSLVARTAARAIVTGNIIKTTGNRFLLELIVTQTETGTVLASHSNTYSDAEQAVRRATEDLLTQLGLRFSETGRQKLYQTSNEADIALARGLNAEREGQSLQALNYLFNAQNFSSTSSQAAASIAAVQTTQQSLVSAGALVRDHFARQEFFQERLNEYNSFYSAHAPFELYYTEPTTITRGRKEGDLDTRQFDLRFKAGLRWNSEQITVMEKVYYEYILNHLNKLPAAQKENLELVGLPEDSELFNGPENFKFNLGINVENENGAQIASGTLELFASLFYYDGKIYASSIQEKDALLPNIKYVENQFRELYVVITSINGVDVRTVGESGFMRLVQIPGTMLPSPIRGNLPRALANRMTAEAEKSAQEQIKSKENDKMANRIAREREREEKKMQRTRLLSGHPMNRFYYGIDVNGGLILPSNSGSVGFGLMGGYKGIGLRAGAIFYPGIQKDATKAYLGSADEVSIFGIDLGASYSLILNPKWHISAGGGISLVSLSEDNGNEKKLDTIPNFQAWFNYQILNLGFIKVGYRADIYPEVYNSIFTKTPKETKQKSKIFWGHNIFIGFMILPGKF